MRPEEILEAGAACARIRVHADVRRYVVRIARATRDDPDVQLGASPRATLALHRATQVVAAMRGRDYVTPDDIKQLATAVLAHRLVVTLEARLRGRDASSVVQQVLDSVPVPVDVGDGEP